MPIGLDEVLEDDWVPRRSGIQNEQSDAAPVTIAVVDGWVKYTNNGAAFGEKNTTLFDTSTGHIDVSALPLWSKVDFILTTNILMTNPNGYIKVKIVIPDTAGDIEVNVATILPVKNTAHDKSIVLGGYIGDKAIEFGFDIYTSVEVDSAEFANRRILLRS